MRRSSCTRCRTTTAISSVCAHFATYFHARPAARGVELVWVSAVVRLITVPVAFVFAYALTRSCLPFKGTFG